MSGSPTASRTPLRQSGASLTALRRRKERNTEMGTSCVDDISEVLLRERAAKDLGRWDEMAGCFAPDSFVRISWFQGSGSNFVEAARARAAAGGTASFHEIGALSVTSHEDRALAHASCTVHLRGRLDPTAPDAVEFDIASRQRLAWRVRRVDGRWMIDRLDAIYMREAISPVDPATRVPGDLLALADGHRPTYRFLSLLLAGRGHRIDPDLPGIDRPDLVEAMLSAQQSWLDTAATGRR